MNENINPNPNMQIKDLTYQLTKKYNIRANKALGQNFLIDYHTLKSIVQVAQIASDDIVIEVGPGIGTLTKVLAETNCKRVIAIELDRRMMPVLEELKQQYSNLEVIYEDILKLDIKTIVGDQPFKVVANLPYYITTPIIMSFLESDLSYERLVFMVQSEVAERMATGPGSKIYGSLSVAVQYRTKVQVAFSVAPECFVPMPGVDSAVIVCEKRQQAAVKVHDEKMFFQIVKAAFSQRRKMISNTLKNLGLTTEQMTQWLELAQIDGKRRAETLSLEEYAKLENTYDKW